MIGLFVIHPRAPYPPPVQKDFGFVLQEWAILPNNTVPNTLSMEFNWLTMNGKAGPGHHADARQAGRARAHPLRQHRHGPPSHAPARAPVRGDRHRGRAHPGDAVVPQEHGPGRRGAGPRRRVRRRPPRRLDAALPPAAPHDEPDGLDGRADGPRRPRHAHRRAAWRRGWGWCARTMRSRPDLGPSLGRGTGIDHRRRSWCRTRSARPHDPHASHGGEPGAVPAAPGASPASPRTCGSPWTRRWPRRRRRAWRPAGPGP